MGVIFMARNKLKARAFIEINGENVLWYEVDAEKNVTWHLPKDIKQGKEILKNIGRDMSLYCSSHPTTLI